VFDLDDLWDRLAQLDGTVVSRVQTGAMLDVKKLGERATRWLLRNRRSPIDVAATALELHEPVRTAVAGLATFVPPATSAELERAVEALTKDGLPPSLAEEVAVLPLAVTTLDIVDVAAAARRPVEEVATAYFLVDDTLGLGWLRHQITSLPRGDRWRSLARSALRDDFFAEHKSLLAAVLERGPSDRAPQESVASWRDEHRHLVDRWLQLLGDIRTSSEVGLPQLSVALRELRNLTQRTSGPA
jgi:glutamate dehydrogenase